MNPDEVRLLEAALGKCRKRKPRRSFLAQVRKTGSILLRWKNEPGFRARKMPWYLRDANYVGESKGQILKGAPGRARYRRHIQGLWAAEHMIASAYCLTGEREWREA